MVLALGDEGHLSGCLLKGLKWTEELEEPAVLSPHLRGPLPTGNRH